MAGTFSPDLVVEDQVQVAQTEVATPAKVNLDLGSLMNFSDMVQEKSIPITTETGVNADVPVDVTSDDVVNIIKTPTTVTDETIPVQGRNLLNMIAMVESGGDYNVIVGEGKSIPGAPGSFESFADHPRIVGMETSAGKSTAAGRYQITATTWDFLKSKYPDLTDFSPKAQDRAAWRLAQSDYKKRTGRELLRDLETGNTNFIAKGLENTWTGLRTIDPEKALQASSVIRYDNASAKRSQRLTNSLESKIAMAVGDVFGKGYTVSVYSGGQESNKEGEGTGSVRHNKGMAGDIRIIDPAGKVVKDKTMLNKLKDYWLGNGLGSVGTFMPGAGIHIDEWTEDKLLPGMGLFWNYGESVG
jgi:muramidase (phage lysozyme)